MVTRSTRWIGKRESCLVQSANKNRIIRSLLWVEGPTSIFSLLGLGYVGYAHGHWCGLNTSLAQEIQLATSLPEMTWYFCLEIQPSPPKMRPFSVIIPKNPCVWRFTEILRFLRDNPRRSFLHQLGTCPHFFQPNKRPWRWWGILPSFQQRFKSCFESWHAKSQGKHRGRSWRQVGYGSKGE